jgi:RHS repeat-associated protein
LNIQSGEKEFIYGDGYPTTFHQIYPGDFNGDGITDLLTYNYTADNPIWEIGIFTGNGFVQMDDVPDIGHFDLYDISDAFSNKLLLFDFNNDNFTDIMVMSKENPDDETANYSLHYSNGNEFNSTMTGSFPMAGGFVISIMLRNYILRLETVTLVMDFNGDAYADFYLTKGTNNDFVYLHDPSNTYNRVLGFTNGFGEQVRPHYQPLTNKTIYTKGTSSSYPLRDIQPPLYVVSEVARETVDYGLQTTEQYTYQGAKVHLQGKGYLGFEKRRIHQLRQNIIAEEINAVYQPQNKYFYPFNTSSNTYVAKTGFKLSETLNTINHQANEENELVFFPYNNQVNAWSKEYTSKKYVLSTRTEAEYDDFGNLTLQQAWYDSLYIEPHIPSSEFSHKNITGIQYISDTDNWIFLPHIIDKKSHYHNQPIVFNKTINFYHDKNSPFYPLLETKYDCIEGDPLNELTTRTDYTYDIYGNPTSVTLSAPHDPSSPASRTTTMAYDATYKHRLLTSTTNPLGYVSSFTYDDAYGWKLTETDPNGFETSFNPHPFGTESMTTLPDGSRQGTALRWAHKHPDAPDNATYYSWQKQSGSAPSRVFYHKTGAELRRVSTGFDGSAIYTDTYYDENNRLHKTSLPYVKEDKKKYYTTYGYDDIGRTTMIEAPDGARTITQYHKATVTTTNALGQRSSREHNAAGWLTKITDARDTEVKYSYFSDGKLHQTMIASAPSTLITLSYNGRRQRSSLSDPNYGLMQTTYNAFSELISQSTPRGHETLYTYDKLGRMTTRTETEGTTTWNYAITNGLLGTLKFIESESHITAYAYDELLRTKTITENINGTTYNTSYTYDRNSRPQSITHPSGFTEQLSYNRHGYQHRISDAQTNKNLWQLLDQYPAGMTKRSATGNGTLLNYYSYNPETLRLTNSLVAKPDKTMIQQFGYDYDAIGNMTYRSKTLPGGQQLKEEFWYDQLNRLTDIKLNGQPTGEHDYDPQGLGNITAKTANGQQIYTNAQYGEGTHGPHAITSATNTANAFPEEEQIAEYTSYEQLKSLTQGTLGLSIMYGHHHQRIRQKYWDEATQTATLKLWAGACEYITHNGQTTTLTYLSSPDGLYALHRILPDGSENIHYLHTDHLGSWTAVTDETGTVVDEQSYDAWGNRRDPATWTSYNYTPPEPQYDRGFTGHEHLDGFQLINMNGRMYDPVVSRMLAPDNFVQTPDFSQNFNRYSYCLNNPLKYTDPDGEIIIPILIGAGISVLTNGISNSINDRPFFEGAGKAAIIGGIGGAFSFGIGQAAAGMTGFGKVTFQTLAHGHLGGVMSGMSGGTYGQGFLSGAAGSLVATGAGSLFGDASKGVQALGTIGGGALAGGIGAEIAGGNFWDGARNGAISAGLNHGIHSGLFGEGLMMSAITGRTRHLFGPDAIATTASLNGSAGVNVGAETGGIEVLRGSETGWYPINDVSSGVGLLDVSLSLEVTKLYYSGTVRNIYANTFYGNRWEGNFSFVAGGSVGLNVIYSRLPSNEFVVGYGISYGIGVGSMFSGNINWGASGSNAKQLRDLINSGLGGY